jgi:hypothetical protein
VTLPEEPGVWVFHGEGGRLASAVFTTVEKADAWVAEHKLSGLLTWYPLDTGIYQWVIAKGYWTPKRKEHYEPRIIQGFSSYVHHHHYENGRRAGIAATDTTD